MNRAEFLNLNSLPERLARPWREICEERIMEQEAELDFKEARGLELSDEIHIMVCRRRSNRSSLRRWRWRERAGGRRGITGCDWRGPWRLMKEQAIRDRDEGPPPCPTTRNVVGEILTLVRDGSPSDLAATLLDKYEPFINMRYKKLHPLWTAAWVALHTPKAWATTHRRIRIRMAQCVVAAKRLDKPSNMWYDGTKETA